MTKPGPKQSGNPRKNSPKDEKRQKKIQEERVRENAKTIAFFNKGKGKGA